MRQPLPAPAEIDRDLTALYRRVEQQVAEDARPRPVIHHRRWMILTGIGVLALIAALVATDTVGISDFRFGAAADAATLLTRAAADTIHMRDPVVGPGQYLLIRTRESQVDDHGGAVWREAHTIDVYIPADRNRDWYWVRTPYRPYAYLTPGSRTVAEAVYRQAIRERGFTGPRAEAYPRGDIDGSGRRYSPDGIDIAGLPTEPRTLLNRLYRLGLGAGQNPDQEAFAMTADLLRSGLVAAPTRAALYRAAALIPDVTVTDRSVNLDGRIGVAIGRTEPRTGQRQDIVIDTDTGLLIGERDYTTKTVRIGGHSFPGRTAGFLTSVTASAADRVPADALTHLTRGPVS